VSLFDITTESWLHKKLNYDVMMGFKVLDGDEYWAGLILKMNPDVILFVRASDGKYADENTGIPTKMKPEALDGKVLAVAHDKQQQRFVIFLIKSKTVKILSSTSTSKRGTITLDPME